MLADSIPEQFSCAICQLLMYEPVTTNCGHNFCKGCLGKKKKIFRLPCLILLSPFKHTGTFDVTFDVFINSFIFVFFFFIFFHKQNGWQKKNILVLYVVIR